MNDSADITDSLKARLTKNPLHQALNLDLVSADGEAGIVVIKAPFQDLVERGAGSGRWHGGIMATLIDIAAVFAIWAKLGHGAPTVDLRIDYLRPAVNTDLTVTGRIAKLGRTLTVADVDIADDNGKAVAKGRGVYVTSD